MTGAVPRHLAETLGAFLAVSHQAAPKRRIGLGRFVLNMCTVNGYCIVMRVKIGYRRTKHSLTGLGANLILKPSDLESRCLPYDVGHRSPSAESRLSLMNVP